MIFFDMSFLKKNSNDSVFDLYSNFQAYTELAIAASNRLIIPLNAGKRSYCKKEKGLVKNCEYCCSVYCSVISRQTSLRSAMKTMI